MSEEIFVPTASLSSKENSRRTEPKIGFPRHEVHCELEFGHGDVGSACCAVFYIICLAQSLLEEGMPGRVGLGGARGAAACKTVLMQP